MRNEKTRKIKFEKGVEEKLSGSPDIMRRRVDVGAWKKKVVLVF